mgnify:CR=1 FL=1
MRPPLKAITLHQPWASIIVGGHKTIENRSWRPDPSHIGSYIALHAGRTFDYFDAYLLHRKFGIFCDDAKCPTGAVIGVALLLDVVEDSDDPWFCGPYGWLLQNVTPIKPVPCPGARGLWNVPEGVLTQIRTNYLEQHTSPPLNHGVRMSP